MDVPILSLMMPSSSSSCDDLQVGILQGLPPWPYLTSQWGVNSVCKAWRRCIALSSDKLWAVVEIVEDHGAKVQSSKARSEVYPPISFLPGLPSDLAAGGLHSSYVSLENNGVGKVKTTRPPATRCALPRDSAGKCM